MTAPEDVNVDELKRRARRRLVGAIVLALAVAVFVPMLLESDPRPLGEDVSVKIPPIDEGKFVNRLTEKTVPAPAKAAPPKAEPKAEPKVEPPKVSAPVTEEAAKVDVAKAEPAKSEPAANVAAAPSSREPAAGDYAVQVFAFSDDKGANSLVNKLKKAGYPAYTEPLSTSKGTLWRVRIGPYATRESAASARDRLKGEGYNGIVAAAK
jgi:DedD protein